MSRAIVIFARLPEIDAAAKRLPVAKAAPLFRAIAAEWLRASREASATAIIACPPNEIERFERIAPEVSRLYIEQRGATFGDRLAAAADEAFARGHRSVLIAGIDAPPPRQVDAVFRRLDDAQAVVAAARDGGINFIALRAPEHALLAAMQPRRRDVLRRCRSHFESLTILAPSTDIDSLDDVRHARGERAWRCYATLLAAFDVNRTAHGAPRILERVSDLRASRAPPV